MSFHIDCEESFCSVDLSFSTIIFHIDAGSDRLNNNSTMPLLGFRAIDPSNPPDDKTQLLEEYIQLIC